MKIKYTKMQGTGNDFIIIDNRIYNFDFSTLSILSKKICKRRLSIGADGFMVIENSKKADFKMIFFNSDGTIGEMCGNGARCIVKYGYFNIVSSEYISVETDSGIINGQIIDEKNISVKLNSPHNIKLNIKYSYCKNDYEISYVELGYPSLPHCIVNCKNLSSISNQELYDLAKNLRHNTIFPKGANVNFYEIQKDGSIFIKTYERGIEDFTLSCGSGSASTALILFLKNKAKDISHIKVSGGDLYVKIKKTNSSFDLSLIGNAVFISDGIILDENLFISF